jgi:hypothetical protein
MSLLVLVDEGALASLPASLHVAATSQPALLPAQPSAGLLTSPYLL